jgi:hypothetical protein
VRSTGERDELQARDAAFVGDHLPLRSARAAALVIDALARLVLPVGCERQVDEAAVALDIAPDAGDVVFLDFAVFELAAESAQRGFVEGEQDQARCVLVEPMHDLGRRAIGVTRLDARFEAIGQRGVLARHRQQAARLVAHDQPLVFVDDVEARWRAVVEGRGKRRHRRAIERFSERWNARHKICGTCLTPPSLFKWAK